MLRFVQAHQVRLCPLHSAAKRFLHNGFLNDKKRIDFDLLFSSCTNLDLAKRLHALIVVSGKAHGTIISTRLVNKYANLGDVSLSSQTFDRMQSRNLYTWNSMISGFVLNARFDAALGCFYRLVIDSGLRPDCYTFPPVLKACRDVLGGRKVHCWVLKLGFEFDSFVGSSLIHMYSRFGFLDLARDLFDGLPEPDMGCWNAMISGYSQNGFAAEALGVLNKMRLEGLEMNSRTVASLLPICAESGDVMSGMLIHLYVVKNGFLSHLFVCNGLINMYAKFGRLHDARSVFDQMEERDIVTWNSMVAAYEQNNDPITALMLFDEMKLTPVRPDIFTLTSLVSTVTQLGDCRNCRVVHGFVLRRGWLGEDVVIGNAIVDMYGKLGFVDSAHFVFDGLPVKDVVSWNSVITSYSQNGRANEAIKMYNLMKLRSDVNPNQGTWVSVLPAYTHIGALQEGSKIHGLTIKKSLQTDVRVTTCLIDMYGKCGKLHDAMSLFYEYPQESLDPWNAIISCQGLHGNAEIAMGLFRVMVVRGVKPDGITFVSLLSSCSHSGLVDEGLWCFRVMQEVYGITPRMKHYGCIVDLLGRAGQLEMAYEFINKMPIQPDDSIWGALLGACRIHGNSDLAKFASDRLLDIDSENAGYHILTSNVYASVGKWEKASEVRSLANDRGLKKTPGRSSIEVDNPNRNFNLHI